MPVMFGIPKDCNKEFLWTDLHLDACSINSPSGARDKENVSVVAWTVKWFLVL